MSIDPGKAHHRRQGILTATHCFVKSKSPNSPSRDRAFGAVFLESLIGLTKLGTLTIADDEKAVSCRFDSYPTFEGKKSVHDPS